MRSPASPYLLVLAAGFAALQLATSWTPPYGLFHDELYYWAGARRPGLGYVDHPPLAPWPVRCARWKSFSPNGATSASRRPRT